ncbi:hypothetical protein [Streptomyces lavendofoliae]|uniref:hypothetical protein n=1 Tax=Streptomyces lavendofoliae TaxID=67314 RepID=UPI003D8D11EB
MPDVRLEAKFIWKSSVILERSRNAANLLGLTIDGERSDGFLLGNQWLWSYELEVWVWTRLATTLRVDGRTLKIGYQNDLREKAALFIDVVRNPENAISSPGLTETWERSPIDRGLDQSDPRTGGAAALGLKPARARQALASLRRRLPALGVDLKTGEWDPLSQIYDEALRAAPENLPLFVQTPMDAERWLSWLRGTWEHIPGAREAIEAAMNENRRVNGRWFQEHGHGGS